jgi:hypothetical protein
MAIFDGQAALASANNDGEFKIAARHWNADLGLEAGDESYLLRVREGVLVEFRLLDRTELATIRPSTTISASRDDWMNLLKPLPRPFFQDLGRRTGSRRRAVSELDPPPLAT